MEDNVLVHKKVCISVWQQLGMTCFQHSANSPDLNSIENFIWSYIKYIIARDYTHVTFEENMKQIVLDLWNEFADNRWDILIKSMPNRIMKAVIAASGGSTHY